MVLRYFKREPESRPRAPSLTPEQEIEQLRDELDALIVRTNSEAGRLPTGVVPQVRAIEDQLQELLDHAAATTTSSISMQERITLTSTIQDYLPSSLNAYLALPQHFLDSHRTAEGLTAGEELLEQLIVLDSSVRELALAVYSGDVQRLDTQGRFLDTKFGKTDLDLS